MEKSRKCDVDFQVQRCRAKTATTYWNLTPLLLPHVVPDQDNAHAEHATKHCSQEANQCSTRPALFLWNYRWVYRLKHVLGSNFGQHHGLGLRLDELKEHGLKVGQ